MSLLSNILNYKQQQDYLASQKEHARTSALTQTLLDRAADPNTTADEQTVLYNEIGSLMGGGKGKGKSNAAFGGPIGSLIGLFLHHDHAGTDVHDNPLAGLVGEMNQRNQQPTNPTVALAPDVNTTVPTRPVNVPNASIVTDDAGNPSVSYSPGEDRGGELNVSVPGGVTETPGKRYGEMTLGEIADARKMGVFNQQQDAEQRRQIAVADVRHKQAMDAATIREEGRKTVAQLNAASKQSRLDDQQLFQLTKNRDAQEQYYLGVGLEPAEAAKRANQDMIDAHQSLIDQRRASASLSNARALSEPIKVQIMQRNAATNERRAQTYEIRTQADVDKINDDLGGGMSAGQKRLYDTQAAPWLIQLRTAIAEKQRLEEEVAAYRSTQVQAGPSIAAAETRASEAAQKLQEIRDSLSTSTVPSRSHGAQRSSAGAEDSNVRDYANKYFGGDYQAAVRAIQAQRRR